MLDPAADPNVRQWRRTQERKVGKKDAEFKKAFMNTFKEEVGNGQRFAFGKNWKSFLSVLKEDRIKEAEKALLTLLELNNLAGKDFLDIGSGSGLSSLAARRLGARVCSFDYDPNSVECTKHLRSKYFPDDSNWQIHQGSILDMEFLKTLETFDIVYSWGVLHHTGNMWKALENVMFLVKENGFLCVAIYNDQGRKTKYWWTVKKLYCSGLIGKVMILSLFIPFYFGRAIAASIFKRENVFAKYKKNRGMSLLHDVVDWLGGFPFQAAKAECVFNYYKTRGFVLRNMVTSNGLGCNQFVFAKEQKCGNDKADH